VPAKGPSADEVVARARAMIPVLAARSRAARRGRRIADETVAEMQQAGLFRVLQPKRWGGYEMDLHTFYEVQFALAQGDMSSAWIYGVSGVHPWFMALLDDKAAQEVWGSDPSTLICSSLMPAGKAVAVPGGYRLAGRWKYASGCSHCEWALLSVRGISTAALGALQGTLNALLEYSKSRVTRAGGPAVQNPFVQLLCAETAAAIDEMKLTLHRNFRNLHAHADRGETPPLAERLQYKFQSTAVTERCTRLGARIFKTTGAAGLGDTLPFGAILSDLMAGRAHISNQYEYVGGSWGGVMLGLENKDLML